MKLIDTTFLIAWSGGDQKTIESYRRLRSAGGIATTEINAYEVFKGIYRRHGDRARESAIKFNALLGRLTVFPYDRPAAQRTGMIQADLESQGKSVDDLDLMIAGTALANQVSTIVTRNRKHFEKIPGVKVEEH
ncbi:MAG TPA: type II toxin-antitoxin system VapC family toxin [Thermoplasmata archaeon]|nr:type II toxin-antitoxin system VapC family toxin [Thermoplasmata archaeon]